MRGFVMLAPLTIALAGGACSTPLEEYRCTGAADCRSELDSRCEASGHCSFADSECDSGFRFGTGSGSESNTCVSVSEDAGPIGQGPVARIADLSFPCGQTSDFFNAEGSAPSNGRTLTNFAWRLFGPDDELLDSFAGAAQDVVPHDLHRLEGSYERPRINVTTYEGTQLIKTTYSEASTGTLDLSYLLPVDATNAEDNFNLSLSFALGIGTTCDGCQVSVRYVDAENQSSLLGERMLSVGPGMQPYLLDYASVPSSLVPSSVTLQFRFSEPGTYFLDNVSMWESNSGTELIENGSVEEGLDPWTLPVGSPLVLGTDSIPGAASQPGRYSVELKVTDSAGLVSAAAVREVVVSSCSGNDPTPP